VLAAISLVWENSRTTVLSNDQCISGDDMKIQFMLTAAVMWCGAVCLAGEAPPSTRPTKEVYLRLAGEMEGNLQKEILDKWFPTAVDEQGGGFFENYGNDWTRGAGANKSLVYQGRLTWLSAKAAQRDPGKAAMYLAMTRRGAAVLAEKLWDKERGGFYWSVDAGGRPNLDGATQKHTYGNSFGIYSLAASYQATKDQAALDLAKKAFAWLDEHAHDNQNKGYFESVTLDGKPVSGGNPVGARGDQKSMNSSIHLLEAFTGLYQAWPDPTVKARVQEMYEICRDKVYSEPGYLTMFLTPDWQRVPGQDSFGHDVEAGFLLVEAAEVLGQPDDPRAWNAARKLMDHALQYGWDAQRGGLYDSGNMTADGVVTGGLRTEKIWWVEAEQLNALLMLHERYGGETSKYWDAFVKQWDFIKRHQIDHTNGGWYPTVRADGTPASRTKSDRWTECYHQGRAMLGVGERLRRMGK
jgi:mannobiose 2-epimerase